jgi:hypothetical protein
MYLLALLALHQAVLNAYVHMLQYDGFALVLILEIFSQYGSWLGEDLCVYCSLSFIVQLLLINYSSAISALMDNTPLSFKMILLLFLECMG